MHLKDIMSHPPVTCPVTCTLDAAARLMWEFDCGLVPVVDDEGRLVGVVTDRDICMAAYTQGGPLAAIDVTTAMAGNVFACHPDDTVDTAEALMASRQVRRVPVIDDAGRPVGVVSLSDLARSAARVGRGRVDRGVVDTLAKIATPRVRALGAKARAEI